MAFLRGQPNMLSMWDNLRVSNPFLHWAAGFSYTGSVTTAKGAYEGVHSLCKFTDPEVLLYVNLDALRTLRSIIGDEEIGVYRSIDGMFVKAARPQHASVSEEHESLLNHGLDIGFGWHGRVGCRGLSMVIRV